MCTQDYAQNLLLLRLFSQVGVARATLSHPLATPLSDIQLPLPEVPFLWLTHLMVIKIKATKSTARMTVAIMPPITPPISAPIEALPAEDGGTVPNTQVNHFTN